MDSTTEAMPARAAEAISRAGAGSRSGARGPLHAVAISVAIVVAAAQPAAEDRHGRRENTRFGPV